MSSEVRTINELAAKHSGPNLVSAVMAEYGTDQHEAAQMIEFEFGDPKLADDVIDPDDE